MGWARGRDKGLKRQNEFFEVEIIFYLLMFVASIQPKALAIYETNPPFRREFGVKK